MSNRADYNTRCPNCAGQLYPVVLDPDSAPWLCVICRRAWWVSELSPEARLLWRHSHQDHGYGLPAKTLTQAREDERHEARQRGTSALPEHLALLPRVALEHLSTARLRAGLKRQVKAEMKRKGG